MKPMNFLILSKHFKARIYCSMIALLFSVTTFSSPSWAYNLEKALYQAIADNNKSQIHSTLKKGISINEGNYLNNVALKKNRDMFKYLLDMGGDINGVHPGPLLSYEDQNDVGGKTPLCLIVSNFLSSKKGFETVTGSDEWVEFLLSNGADPNKICYGKYSPLMMVSGKGADEKGLTQWERLEVAMKIIVLLIKNGADLNARIDGSTALDFANASNNLDLVMFLKSLGASQ